MENINYLTITGKYGNKKFELQLLPETTVQELCCYIEKETHLPIQHQKLIHNGRTLNARSEDLCKNLTFFGLKSPAKVMVLGKKPEEEDENFKVMKKWEITCESVEKQLLSIQNSIEDMEKGYTPKQFMQESLPKLKKKINFLAEELMKILFCLDGLTFFEDQKEARAKRKCLVDRIHSLHKQCDQLSATANQLQ